MFAVNLKILCYYHIGLLLRGYYEKPTIYRQLYVFFMKLRSI